MSLMSRDFGDAALSELFAPLEPFLPVLLAVSGGPDSIALMHLAHRWLKLSGREREKIAIGTVDHRLRPESTHEAAFVADEARALAFSHVTLVWEGSKPKSGIQAAARRMRYDLLASHCRAAGFRGFVTAHTEDDQAETFIMRLSRGSGIDGLAAMAPRSDWKGVPILRPFLGVSKRRLVAYLEAHDIPFLQDPSNDNAGFERVRIRQTMKALASAGVRRTALARSASRLSHSRAALDQVVKAFLDEHFRIGPLGQGEISLDALLAQPFAIAVGALKRAVDLIGGRRGARLARIEALASEIGLHMRQTTLGGCLIRVDRGAVRFYREPGRLVIDAVSCVPATEVLWDNRFAISFAPACKELGEIRPLGAAGYKRYREEETIGRPVEGNRLAALTTPALWIGDRLMSAPLLGFVDPVCRDADKAPVSVQLAPPLAHFVHAD